MKKVKKFFVTPKQTNCVDMALLLLRVVVGLAFTIHGYGKVLNPFEWAQGSPIPGFLQALAAFAEFGGGIALVIGLVTPLASLGIAITMLVAASMHAFVFGDPFVNTKGGGSYELASVFFAIAILLIATGPGRFSLDRKIFGVK